jgi:hypothetical protein
METHTAYEQGALKDIEAWKNPKQGILRNLMEKVDGATGQVIDRLLQTPGASEVVDAVVGALTNACSGVGAATVRTQEILAEYQKLGYAQVQSVADIEALPLRDADRVVGFLAAKYKAIAIGEGAATGAAGLAGMVIDLPVLLTLNLRAIFEYASYYGFDISKPEERLFAVQVLNAASSSGRDRQMVVRTLGKLMSKQAFDTAAVMTAIKKAIQMIGFKTVKKSVVKKAVPLVGVALSAAFNALFTADTCAAASALYRERFLQRKDGVEVLTVG